MANVLRTVKLPDGTLQKVTVPEEWGASDIRAALVRKGVISGEAGPRQEQQEQDLPPFEDPIRRTETAPDVPSMGERFLRSQELGVRNVIEGVAGFPALVGDAANTLLNFIPGVNLQKPSEMLRGALTEAGFPEPETPSERIAATVTQATAGAIGGISAAKNIPTAFSQILTEKAGMQTSAAAAGGASMAVANESDVGPLGQMAIGVVGAIVGGMGHGAISSKFARNYESRLRLKDKALAEQEVKDMLAEEHISVPKDSEELRAMTEQLNELRVQGKIQEKVRQLQPAGSDTVEQARFKRRELQRMGQTEQPSIEMVRARTRARERQVAEIEAKIREKESNEVRAKPAVRKAIEVGANAADQAEAAVSRALAVTTDPTVPRQTSGSKIGYLKRRDAFGNDVIGRIQKISPSMAIAVRRVTQRGHTRANDDTMKIMQFYDSAQYNRLPKADRITLDRHLLNGDREAAQAIMQRVDGLNEIYDRNVRSLMMAMQRERVSKGADGFIEDFHPRVVRNVNALRKEAKRRGTGGRMDQALADAERQSRKQRGHGLDEREVAQLINQYVGGRPLKVLKDRRINEITPEMQRHYETSRNSMIDYIRKFHDDAATLNFFKNSLGKEMDFGKNAVNEVTLGEVLAKSLQEHGGLNPSELGEMAELLSAQFGVGRQGPGAFQRNFKNLFTAGTLGNPMSTLTQFGDIAPVMSKFGVLNTLRAASPLRNKAGDVSVFDIGVRELSKDMRSVHGTANLVRKSLQFVGFDKLDTVMAGVGSRSAKLKWQRMATKNPAAMRKKLEPFYGKVDAAKLVDDFKAGRLTDDAKTWLLHEMGNIRPISREDMPLHWQQHPNGRALYSLLSWTLKQMNYARNNAQAEWRAGRKLSATKKLAGLALLMGMTNGTVYDVKDFMLGRDIEPGSNFVAGMLAMGMSGKYAFEALTSNRGGEALGSIVPVIGITTQAAAKTLSGVLDADLIKILEATPAGRNIVNLLSGPIPDVAVGALGAAINAVIPEAVAKEPQAKAVPKDKPYTAAKELLTRREGDVGTVYQNTIPDGEGGTKEDVPTAGIGHALTAAEQRQYPVGSEVPKTVRDRWFRRDSAKAFNAATKQAKAIGRPDMVPVLTSVNFQLGTGWTSKFKNTWRLMKEGKFEEAAEEAAKSKWFRQTPVRVKDLQEALVS